MNNNWEKKRNKGIDFVDREIKKNQYDNQIDGSVIDVYFEKFIFKNEFILHMSSHSRYKHHLFYV